jgi:hypothetical protein
MNYNLNSSPINTTTQKRYLIAITAVFVLIAAVSIIFVLIFATKKELQAAFPCPNNGQIAFPGAEGAGRCANGWRGGAIMLITNLNDSGPGSLRACLEADIPRVCVFRVSGTLDVESRIKIQNSDLYVVGQTSPGGIQIRPSDNFPNSPGAGETYFGIGIDAPKQVRDIVLRYLRIRAGHHAIDGVKIADLDSIAVTRVKNVMLDHLSLQWASDGNIDWSNQGYYQSGTLQASIVGEPLSCDSDGDGIQEPSGASCAQYNQLMNPPQNNSVHSIYNSIFYGARGRVLFHSAGGASPGVRGATVDVANTLVVGGKNRNVISFSGSSDVYTLNYAATWWKGSSLSGNTNVGVNFKQQGYSGDKRSKACFDSRSPSFHQKLCPNGCTSGISGGTAKVNITITSDSSICGISPALPAAVNGLEACRMLVTSDTVKVGASRFVNENGEWVDSRDAVDKRILRRINGCDFDELADDPLDSFPWILGKPTDHPHFKAHPEQYDSKGYPIITPHSPYPDSDHDGMSDTWEAVQCPGGDCDPWADDELLLTAGTGGNGYSNAEEFWNGTAPIGGNVPPPPPTPQCSDSIDNDNDGLTDYPSDPGCTSASDNDEYNPPTPTCGDNACNGTETCSTCSADCGTCPVTDSDQDGIPDTEDQCPDTPPNTQVDSTGCPIAEQPTPFSQLIEAESMSLLSPAIVIDNDINAFNNQYISIISGINSTSPQTEASYTISVPRTDNYYLWARIMGPSTSQDAVYIGIDTTWDRVFPSTTNVYEWVKADNGTTDNYAFYLTKGTHTIKAAHGELFARLDALYLTNNTTGTPPTATNQPPSLPGDLNNDNIVNSLDWSLMNAVWFTSDPTADLNHDGQVNSVDFSVINDNWGRVGG